MTSLAQSLALLALVMSNIILRMIYIYICVILGNIVATNNNGVFFFPNIFCCEIAVDWRAALSFRSVWCLIILRQCRAQPPTPRNASKRRQRTSAAVAAVAAVAAAATVVCTPLLVYGGECTDCINVCTALLIIFLYSETETFSTITARHTNGSSLSRIGRDAPRQYDVHAVRFLPKL